MGKVIHLEQEAATMFPIETLCENELLPFLARETARILRKAETSDRPVFLHMLGVPGSGKSSAVSVLLDRLTDYPPTYVGFDRLMESIPDYQALEDKAAAFHQYELPARAAGYSLLKRLVEKRANILLDHGGSFPQNIEMLRYARQEMGYSVIVVHIATSPETAKRRVWARQEIEGRHTPLDYIDERDQIVNRLLDGYKAVAHAYFEIPNELDMDDKEENFGVDCDWIAEKWVNLAGEPAFIEERRKISR